MDMQRQTHGRDQDGRLLGDPNYGPMHGRRANKSGGGKVGKALGNMTQGALVGGASGGPVGAVIGALGGLFGGGGGGGDAGGGGGGDGDAAYWLDRAGQRTTQEEMHEETVRAEGERWEEEQQTQRQGMAVVGVVVGALIFSMTIIRTSGGGGGGTVRTRTVTKKVDGQTITETVPVKTAKAKKKRKPLTGGQKVAFAGAAGALGILTAVAMRKPVRRGYAKKRCPDIGSGQLERYVNDYDTILVNCSVRTAEGLQRSADYGALIGVDGWDAMRVRVRPGQVPPPHLLSRYRVADVHGTMTAEWGLFQPDAVPDGALTKAELCVLARGADATAAAARAYLSFKHDRAGNVLGAIDWQTSCNQIGKV